MGRQWQSPLDEAGPLGQLSLCLRNGLIARGMTIAQAAEELYCSPTKVQRAMAGTVLPDWKLTQDCAQLFGLEVTRVKDLWDAADQQRLRARHGTRRTSAPSVRLIRTADQLSAALIRQHEEAGRPRYRTMARRGERVKSRSQDFARMSHTSAWRIATGKGLPGSVEQLRSFLLACDVPRAVFPLWAAAWERARIQERQDRRARQRNNRGDVAISAEEAKTLMRAAGLVPLDPYPGWNKPWAARCVSCRSFSRFRLNEVACKARKCPVCHTGEGSNEQATPRSNRQQP